MVENFDFLHTMDSWYTVPGRVVIGKEIEKVVIESKAKIGSFSQEANKISICADIWSKKGNDIFIILASQDTSILGNITEDTV